MDGEIVSVTVLNLLHPHWMASFALLLSGIYFFKYMCVKNAIPLSRNPIYILRSFLWLVFAVVWATFLSVDQIVGRAMLRSMIAVIMFVEVSYNILYIKDALVGVWRWILQK